MLFLLKCNHSIRSEKHCFPVLSCLTKFLQNSMSYFSIFSITYTYMLYNNLFSVFLCSRKYMTLVVHAIIQSVSQGGKIHGIAIWHLQNIQIPCSVGTFSTRSLAFFHHILLMTSSVIFQNLLYKKAKFS